MTIEPGRTLLHYRVADKIGEGGMGEVWRAVDTTLDREAAIKILPPDVADDPERMARFEREAKTLASLDHRGIASVYGLHESDGIRFIAMELVDGEDLSERIARGPLPVDEALQIARAIAAALEAAHEAGVVHRDLKPANVRLAPGGRAKVLDFGLAKAAVAERSGQDIATSPTMTSAGSRMGMIVGTAAYMAPEQARGKPVDRRADIWSFGCVLYEMLTGATPFAGGDVAEMLAHVITQEPDFTPLPASLPPRVDDLVRRCLRKDPRVRLPDMADARITLDEVRDAPEDTSGIAPGSDTASPSRSSLALIAVVAVAALALGAWLTSFFLSSSAPPSPPSTTHLELILDPPAAHAAFALAADGSRLVYAGRDEGERHLWVRDLRTYETTRLPGTEGGHMPALAPDGNTLAFFAAGRLKRTSLFGGQPESLSGVPGEVSGITWVGEDEIVFSTNSTVVPWRISAAGGEPAAIELREELEAGAELTQPTAVPGHDLLLATFNSGSTQDGPRVVAVSLSDGTLTTVARGSSPHFVAPDRIVYMQGGQAMTVRVDPSDWQPLGPERPAPIDAPAEFRFETIRLDALFPMAVSADGTLVYVAGRYANRYGLMWLDREGALEATGHHGSIPRLSPSGDRVVTIVDGNIWVHDLTSGESTQLTFAQKDGSYVRWSRDGRRIFFEVVKGGERDVYVLAADGSGEREPVAAASLGGNITSIGPDGMLMGYVISTETSRDIWIADPDGDATLLLATAANERAGAISPTGGLFAYVTDETGADRILIRELPDRGRVWPVTDEGGLSPVWSRDGEELFYRQGDSIMAVSVGARGGAVRVGEPRTIFTSDRLELDLWGNQTFSTAPDGRLLVSVAEEDSVTTRVVLGWGAQLKTPQ